MSTIRVLRPALSGLAASASLAGSLFCVATEEAEAQSAAPALPPTDAATSPHGQIGSGKDRRKSHSSEAGQAIVLPAVKVGGHGAAATNMLQSSLGLSRMPDKLQSTPQTITVIPQIMIEQQQATTVEQVLRYVPGVTVATGEGGGGINGDQFRIRGFDASGDIYVDGLRDFGSYVRDDFATENVMVLKGPSSQSFGNGSSGGVIELENKKAHLGSKNSADVSGGSGPYGRGVLDVNQQIGSTTAVRLVGMLHGQDTVDRDHVYSDRWGLLASVATGLGTDHQITLNYLHQYSNRRPDFGVPIPNALGPQPVAEPVTQYGVPRSTYYGHDGDMNRQDADVITLLYKGKLADWLTVTNDTRFGVYSSQMRFTPVLCLGGVYGMLYGSTCETDALSGNLNTSYTDWAVAGNSQNSYGGENVTTAIAKFSTFGFRHELVAGVDVYSQSATTEFYTPVGPRPAGTLLNPIYYNMPGYSSVGSERISATSWDVGPFINDRIWLLKTLSIMGGVRWDHYHVSGVSDGSGVNATTELASPKAALIWEPTKHQTYYFNFARSFTPPASNITSISTSNGITSGSQANSMTPELSYSYEVGAKFSLLHDRLGLTAAAFRVEKNNARYTDAITNIQVATGDSDRVQGFEFGVTGKITHAWDVQASYTYMDSTITRGAISAFSPTPSKGNRVPYVSRHGLSVWTTYDLTTLFRKMPGRLMVGGGFTYRSLYYVDDSMLERIPGAVTADGMLSYDINRYHAAVNVQNMNNALSYSSAFGNGYATPSAGRTVIGTIGIRF